MTIEFHVESFQAKDSATIRYGVLSATQPNAPSQRPIVFVPGLGGSIKFALNFLKRFVPHHGPVYSMDGRGMGLNEELAPKPSPGDYLQDLDEFIRYLQQKELIQADQSPILMGLSLGSIYTTLFATRYTHPFKALILLAPAFSPHPKTFGFRFRLKNYSRIFYKGIKAMTTMPYGVRELSRDETLYDDPHLQNPMVLPSFYLFLVERMCLKAFKSIRQLRLPTAFVVPGQDVVCCPERMLAAFQQIPGNQKKCFAYPDLYHDVAQELEADQVRLEADLTEWLLAACPNDETVTATEPFSSLEHAGRAR